jgi:hypothetical protein
MFTCCLSRATSILQMSVTMMAATLMRHFRFEAIYPCAPRIPCGYDITVRSGPTYSGQFGVFRLKIRIKKILFFACLA